MVIFCGRMSHQSAAPADVDVNSFPDKIDGEPWHRVCVRTLAAALIEVQSLASYAAEREVSA